MRTYITFLLSFPAWQLLERGVWISVLISFLIATAKRGMHVAAKGALRFPWRQLVRIGGLILETVPLFSRLYFALHLGTELRWPRHIFVLRNKTMRSASIIHGLYLPSLGVSGPAMLRRASACVEDAAIASSCAEILECFELPQLYRELPRAGSPHHGRYFVEAGCAFFLYSHTACEREVSVGALMALQRFVYFIAPCLVPPILSPSRVLLL